MRTGSPTGRCRDIGTAIEPCGQRVHSTTRSGSKPICKVADITIERFSEEFEINGTTGETRPNGGDYFKTITVHIENGSRFYICGRDARDDGYLDVWDDSSRIF